MTLSRRTFVVSACLPMLVASAEAHTMEEVEQDLSTKEKYFQAADKNAPDFDLQDADGKAPNGAPKGACAVPGSTPDKAPITGPVDSKGNPLDPKRGKTVDPQCTNRTADKTVYCTCRCADINGATNDGASYCKCPDGFACTQLVTSIGQGDTGLTGAYCIKDKTDYAKDQTCTPFCDPDPAIKGQKCN